MNKPSEKKKYRINLPKTPFAMKASLAVREPERLKKWEEKALNAKLLTRWKEAKQKFILHDGPPYANGQIHIGHALNKILKDMIVKYKTGRGLNARYVPGWDCHGLPIEHALFKEMGKRKEHVDQIVFRKEARKYADKYVNIQKDEFKRLGIFGEWDNPYLTMNPSYQASIAKSFYELYEKGYVVRGEKPIHWCFDCETALAEAELEYQDKTSKTIFVSFRVPPHTAEQQKFLSGLGADKNTPVHFIIWTTTPWTLPANVGIALHPKLEYGVYLGEKGNIVIVATSAEGFVKERFKDAKVKCLKTLDGTSVQKMFPAYQHPFLERQGKVILADYVSSEEGTGIVHIAPGHGQEDYVHGHLIHKLPMESPVDDTGKFSKDFGKHLPLKGKHVFKSNEPIIKHLDESGHLEASEDRSHSYPHCWRCKKPVIFRSTPQWFLKIDHLDLRKRVMETISNSDKTRWFPDWGKNRILGMMETRPDWCLSRQRLWGVPIPLGVCKECGEPYLTEELKKSVLETFAKESADSWFEKPREHFISKDAVCKKCGSKELKCEMDILDVWFDSGVSHQAVLEQGHQLGFPCELYLEGSDQHRGWFQTSLIAAVALRDRSPFKAVLTHGFVVDGQGKKMSKSLGNVVKPQEVMGKFGADILRLWVSSCDYSVDVRLSPEILDRMSEAYRKIRNTFRYLLGNLADFNPEKDQVPFKQMDSIDRWALTRLNHTAEEVIRCYEENSFHRIYQIIYEFCIVDLSSFYLDVLKDRLYTYYPNDPKRRSTQTALFILCKALAQLISPILSFTTDEVWESFPFGKEASVHESVWDEKLWTKKDEDCFQKWESIRQIRKEADVLIEKLREAKEVGSSLEVQLTVKTKDRSVFDCLEEIKKELKLGCIVSQIDIEENKTLGDAVMEWQWQDNSGKPKQSTLGLVITKAKGTKCARCWKFSEKVGSFKDPALCEECMPVEEKLGAES